MLRIHHGCSNSMPEHERHLPASEAPLVFKAWCFCLGACMRFMAVKQQLQECALLTVISMLL